MPYLTICNDKTFPIESGLSLVEAANKSGVFLPYSCKTGRCNSCRCRVIKGETVELFHEVTLTAADKEKGWILGCARAAATDLEIEVEDLSRASIPSAKTLPCRISYLERLAPDVLKVRLRLPPDTLFQFISGQYVVIIGRDGIRRSYSIANAHRQDNSLELHIRSVKGGEMSDYWFNKAAPNDLLRLHGPNGTFFLREVAQKNLVFLATGTGIAPIKSILESLPSLTEEELPRQVIVLWGGRYKHDLYFDMANVPGSFRYIPVLSRAGADWQGERGYVQDVLLNTMPNLANSAVYACGSNSMIQSARTKLTAAGLSEKDFYSDAFVCSSAE